MKDTSAQWVNYRDRMNRVSEYIYEHLDDKIDLMTLADVACLSHYHWHRVYQALHGESVVASVKRLRLQRAATLLAESDMSIAAVAKASGYANLQSFTRIFAQAYGTPPSEYRNKGLHRIFRSTGPNHDSEDFRVDIREISSTVFVCVEHRGSYVQIDKAFGRLLAWLGQHGLLSTEMRLISVYFGESGLVPEKELRSLAGIAVPADRTGRFVDALRTDRIDAGPNTKTICVSEYRFQPDRSSDQPVMLRIPGGTHAVLRYRGPYASMHAAYQWLYGTWLVSSGHGTATEPVFEEYLNNPRDTQPRDLLTDICLPISPASPGSY